MLNNCPSNMIRYFGNAVKKERINPSCPLRLLLLLIINNSIIETMKRCMITIELYL